MVWLHPAALLGVLAVAGPLIVHLLRRRPAHRLVVPTVRFVSAESHSSIRVRRPSDPLLLVVRVAIIATAALALGAPLVITGARLAEWDARVARAVVMDVDAGGSVAAERSEALRASAYRWRVFASRDLPENLVQAAAWLDDLPPARREIVVLSHFRLGTLRATHLEPIAAHVGLRFERTSGSETHAPPHRAVLFERRRWLQETTATAAGTTAAYVEQSQPVGAGGTSADIPSSVAEFGALAPAEDQPIHLRFDSTPDRPRGLADRSWQIGAGQRLLLDPRSAATSARVTVATEGLAVFSAVDPGSYEAASLAAAALDSRQDPSSLAATEPLRIPDNVLQSWAREPRPPEPHRFETVDRNDGRWLWALVLVLLGSEWRMRRRRSDVAREVHANAA